jgi:hypothetical protein
LQQISETFAKNKRRDSIKIKGETKKVAGKVEHEHDGRLLLLLDVAAGCSGKRA